MKSRVLLTVVLSMSLSGCTWLDDVIDRNGNINGARTVVADSDTVAEVDLIAAIDPKPELSRDTCFELDKSGRYQTKQKLDEATARICLRNAYKDFDDDLAADREARRNTIAGQLRAASELRCTEFTEHLNSIQADGNLFFGTLATSLAGAGAIVTSSSTARALSGLAGIATGTRAEFNADIFFKEAAPVIVNAIGEERAKLRAEMDKNMTKKIGEYPLPNAIADVFRYNNSCSLVQGLSAASKSITLAEHPGMDALIKAQLQFNFARQVAANPTMVDSSVIKEDGTADTAVLMGEPSPSHASADGNPSAAYQSALDDLAQEVGSFSAVLDDSSDTTDKAAYVRQLVFPTPPPPANSITDNLKVVLNGASGELATSCQAKALGAQATLESYRLQLASAPNPSSDIKSEMQTEQLRANLLVSKIEAYTSTITNALEIERQQFLTNADTFKSGDMNDASKQDIKAKLDKLNTALSTLSGNIGVSISAGC